MFKTGKSRAEQRSYNEPLCSWGKQILLSVFFSHPLFLHCHSHDDEFCRHAYLRSTSQLAQGKKKKKNRLVPTWGSAFCAFACMHSCVSLCVRVINFFLQPLSYFLAWFSFSCNLLMQPPNPTPPPSPTTRPIPSAPSGYFSILFAWSYVMKWDAITRKHNSSFTPHAVLHFVLVLIYCNTCADTHTHTMYLPAPNG